MVGKDEKIIDSSKIKILIVISMFLLFTGLGLWVITIGASQVKAILHLKNSTSAYLLGWFFFLFFGYCGVIWVKKLLNNQPGLVLNNLGITENSTATPAGFIPWKDIAGFNVCSLEGQRILAVALINSESYIQVGNSINRFSNKTKYKKFGSPVLIISKSLKIDFDSLLKLCNEYFVKYGNPPIKQT